MTREADMEWIKIDRVKDYEVTWSIWIPRWVWLIRVILWTLRQGDIKVWSGGKLERDRAIMKPRREDHA